MDPWVAALLFGGWAGFLSALWRLWGVWADKTDALAEARYERERADRAEERLAGLRRPDPAVSLEPEAA